MLFRRNDVGIDLAIKEIVANQRFPASVVHIIELVTDIRFDVIARNRNVFVGFTFKEAVTVDDRHINIVREMQRDYTAMFFGIFPEIKEFCRGDCTAFMVEYADKITDFQRLNRLAASVCHRDGRTCHEAHFFLIIQAAARICGIAGNRAAYQDIDSQK